MSDVPTSNAELAFRIEHARFSPVRIRQGYVMRPVDDLLDELSAAARAGRPLAAHRAAANLTVSSWRECYSIEEVDAFLAALPDTPPVLSDAVPSATDLDHPDEIWRATSLRALRDVRFRGVWLTEGCATDAVDDLLYRLVVAVEKSDPLAPIIAASSLARVRFKQAYAVDEVDEFLSRVSSTRGPHDRPRPEEG